MEMARSHASLIRYDRTLMTFAFLSLNRGSRHDLTTGSPCPFARNGHTRIQSPDNPSRNRLKISR